MVLLRVLSSSVKVLETAQLCIVEVNKVGVRISGVLRVSLWWILG